MVYTLKKPQLAVVVLGVMLCAHPLAAQPRLAADSLRTEEDFPVHSPHQHQLQEVTTTARRHVVGSERVSQTLSNDRILQGLGLSMGQLLEEVNGVAALQTGANIAKPIVQGMYGTRLLVVNNGARQTGQQWGLDHAPEIDINSTSSMHVVKGAESVRYGSEALGGVVLLEQRALPFGCSHTHGRLSTLYGTNGRRFMAVGEVEGSFARQGQLAWRLQATYGNSGDRSSARYLLNNTGSRDANVMGALGWKRGGLRTELYYSLYYNKAGVMLGAQMGNEDLLRERITLGQPTVIEPYSRSIGYPYQQVTHHNVTTHLHYTNERLGAWYWIVNFQQDDRAEHRLRRMNRSDIPAVALHLRSWQNQLRWRKSYGDWRSEVGVQWLSLRNRNEAGTGVVPIIPNYTENTIGGYFLQHYAHGKWQAEAGVRFDHQLTKAAGYDWVGEWYGGTLKFNNLSYHLGLHHRFSPALRLTSNLGVAWRAPHVYELYSNGNELGSGIFVRGNNQLQSERSYKWITSLSYQRERWSAKVDAFVQWIDNYIYDAPMHRNIVVASGAYPLFAYRQTEALFRGVEAEVEVELTAELSYRAMAALIHAHERDTGQYLPYIPAERIGHELSWSHKWGKGRHLWASTKHQWVARQHRFNPAADLIAFAPDSYHLIGLEMGYEQPFGRWHRLRFSLSVDNLLNEQYKDYTNRARYYAHDLGRDIRVATTWQF